MALEFSPKQNHAINESNATINIWEGSVRSGKSYSCLYRFIKELAQGPEGLYLICGKSERTIKNNIIAELDKMTGYCIRYNKVEASFTLWGKKVICVGANDERAVGKIQGVTLAGALVDEITILPENFFDMLVSRLSIEGAKLFGTCNPDSPYHWLKERFIDKSGQGLVQVFTFNLSDNPSLPKAYVENLKKAYSGLWYKRYIEGLWVLAEGSVYDFFDHKLHTLGKPHTYAKEYFLGVDYGTHNPFAAVLIGYNNEHRPFIWVEKEFYYDPAARGMQQTDFEFLQWLQREFFDYYPIKTVYLDPSAESFQVELKRARKPVVQANNDVVDGIRTVARLMAQGDMIITHKCNNLIREIEGYCWDPKSIKLGEDKPLKKNDHLCDALRYAIHTRFQKAKLEKRDDPPMTPNQGLGIPWGWRPI